jgi:aspartyl-tRNA(Asn)/glutamyl-tRNA(Gln) amidotransferase subunit A
VATTLFTIADYRRALDQEKVSASFLVNYAHERALRHQPYLNAFVTLLDSPEIPHQTTGPLAGIPYALKDNFSTKGILSTGSSNILRDYIPVFDATVVERLRDAGAVLIGKTVLDELAMGGTGMTGHTGLVHNPWNKERMTGGSSAGSAAAVCAGIVPFALGSDTGDSVRKPAAYCGIVGFKPSWGRISRLGLFPFAPSLDHVGVFARCVRDAAMVTEVLAGPDARDMTCSAKPVPAF